MSIHAQFNYVEAWFWITTALVVLVGSLSARKKPIGLYLCLSLLLILFGLSDFVEMQTGAWWKPWWLLLWKGLCLVGFAGCFLYYRSTKKL